MRIGFIGLGLMGRPMARHLERAGHTLHLWARHAEVVITMVAAAPDVEAICFGADGLASGAALGPSWST